MSLDHPERTRSSPSGTGGSCTDKLSGWPGPVLADVLEVLSQRLAGEPLRLVCRADHRLAGQDEVSIRQLAGERFVEVPPGCPARQLASRRGCAADVIGKLDEIPVGIAEVNAHHLSVSSGLLDWPDLDCHPGCRELRLYAVEVVVDD
jgi:LysR substrate binding domain